MNYKRVKYKNRWWAVIDINNSVPVVVDWKDFKPIQKLKKNWKVGKQGNISCFHKYKGDTKEVYMHEVVLALKQQEEGGNVMNKSIVHINRIGVDNRRDNLRYDTTSKDTNKNIKKKNRTIDLPKDSGINVDDIPTYVWYMKPDSSHGERFMVSVGDINWKTTSSKKLSLKYKLEEAKMFLRQMKIEDPDSFKEYSMNGDLTKDGEKLTESFYSIVQLAGYDVEKIELPNNTDMILKKSKQTKFENKLLKSQYDIISSMVGGVRGKNRRIVSNLPKECSININDIPKHCYYKPAQNYHGGYFVVDNHPEQKVRLWQTTSSKNVSVDDKFKELLQYINSL